MKKIEDEEKESSETWIISAVLHMRIREVKIFISVDIYGDTKEIIEDCLYAIEPFIEDVIPENMQEQYFDYTDI